MNLPRGSIHNTRILRFLLVLSIVILTIFVYASYSTNPSLVPPHMRVAGSPLAITANSLKQQEQNVSLNKQNLFLGDKNSLQHIENENSLTNNSIMHESQRNLNGIIDSVSNSVNESSNAWSNAINGMSNAKKQHYREPTIDEDALGLPVGNNDDGQDEIAFERLLSNDLLEEQYSQNLDNTANNPNNSNAVQFQQQQQLLTKQMKFEQNSKQIQLNDNNFNKILDSDVLIPTSNLQKFIENADKILKNMTTYPQVGNKSYSPEAVTQAVEVKLSNVKQQEVKDSHPEENTEDMPQPPSVVMAIRPMVDSVKINGNKTPISPEIKGVSNQSILTTNHDTSKGIPTEYIYESGHMNLEINIDKLCPNKGSDLKLLILITSAQSHSEARLAIRQTWGHYGIRRDVSTAFILGRSYNETLNLALSQENFIYGDLIRGNFIDSYNNLTLKTISALEWVDQHCNQAKYILKTDDDMFINVPKLLLFLENHSKDKRTIFGRLAKKWKPIRNRKSKYYVSVEQFSDPVFPAFTTGPAYVLTNDIIHELYIKCLHQVYLKLEDVFTTGIVAQQLNIKRVHANEFLNRRIAFNPCNIRKTISVHMIKSNEQFDLWKKLLDQTTKCK